MAEHLSEKETTEVKKIIKMMGSDAQDESEAIEVSEKVATMSQIFKDMLEMCSEDDKAVNIPNVEGAILKKVLEWAEFHKDDPPFLKEEESVYPRTENEMCDFDRKIFTSLDQETVFKIILGASINDVTVSRRNEVEIWRQQGQDIQRYKIAQTAYQKEMGSKNRPV